MSSTVFSEVGPQKSESCGLSFEHLSWVVMDGRPRWELDKEPWLPLARREVGGAWGPAGGQCGAWACFHLRGPEHSGVTGH